MRNLFVVAAIVALVACGEVSDKQKLPVVGNTKITERIVDGETVYDTVPHTVGYYRLLDQDSAVVTPETVEGKIYVADFFFTSCPSICPIMKTEMLRVYNEFQATDDLMILSHSIDPEYDTVALLKDYAERLGVADNKWRFLTGDKDEIFNLSESSYMITTTEDDTAPGGYIHSGAFFLVDTKKRIRGVYDGTESDQVDRLMGDIRKLLDETNAEKAE